MLDRVRTALAAAISHGRDGRRRARQRLEDLFDRQTFNSLLVLIPLGELTKALVLGHHTVVLPYSAWFVLGLLGAVYWTRLAKAGEAAADTVEDAVDPETK